MQRYKKAFRGLAIGIFGFLIFAYAWVMMLPGEFIMLRGETHSLPAFVAPSAGEGGFSFAKENNRALITPTRAGSFEIDLSAFGILRRSARVSVVEPGEVILGGEAVGIKMYMEGVLVIGLSEIPETGRAPGKEAGILPGDRLLAVNGESLSGSDMLEKRVMESEGAALTVSVCRGEKTWDVNITPVYYEDGAAYKIGLWVRESTAGIGTVTFSLPESGTYAALGHPILDADTEKMVPPSHGSITECEIVYIEKGEDGAPGAVRGVFGEDVGTILKNVDMGLYGKSSMKKDGVRIPIAVSTQVEKGDAVLISDIAGGEAEAYAVEIEKVLHRKNPGTKSLVLRVVDERLLSLTGGIVQGMSGSPIVQNGKLVGAITHVFVNDPTRGYGIFIENMLSEAEKIE